MIPPIFFPIVMSPTTFTSMYGDKALISISAADAVTLLVITHRRLKFRRESRGTVLSKCSSKRAGSSAYFS